MIFRKARSPVHILATVLVIAAAVGCTAQPAVREVEVTREVPVTKEVPVTVQVVDTVEVTREVKEVREIPVTVEILRTVEVTRAPQTVEVTREVPVTRIVAAAPTVVANDASAELLTPTPLANGMGPTPAATPAVVEKSPTPTPSAPAADVRFGSWRMELEQYGGLEVYSFRNPAVAHETPSEVPVLTYQCDTRGRRALYVDWYQPVSTAYSQVPRYSDDPFEQYRDDDLDAIAGLAGSLLELMDDLALDRGGVSARDEMWKRLDRRWQLNPESSHDLVDRLRERNHQGVSIVLDFYVQPSDPSRWNRYGPPIAASIDDTWIVLSNLRTQASASAVGELQRAYRDVSPPSVISASSPLMVAATVTSPEQPVEIVAKWEISGFQKITSYCRAQAQ